MTATEELIPWLRVQLDEDERVAQATIHPGRTGEWTFIEYEEDGQRRWELAFDKIAPDLDDTLLMGPSPMRHIARHDPARVLREVEAKRRIIDSWEASQDDNFPPLALIALDEVVKALALPFADRPGYREEWRP